MLISREIFSFHRYKCILKCFVIDDDVAEKYFSLFAQFKLPNPFHRH